MVTISREKNSLPCETEAIHTDTTPQEETRGDQLRAGARKLRSKATLQLKFSLSYILVIAAVLVLLNSYPLLVSQNLMVTSTQNGLKSTTKVIESALMGLEKLTKENVQAALEGLDESGATRVMVTNSAGLVLYDTRQGGNAVGQYALYSVVAVALRGQDASYCKYDGTAFLSRVATPVVYHNQIVGAVYAYDYDTEQAELLAKKLAGMGAHVNMIPLNNVTESGLHTSSKQAIRRFQTILEEQGVTATLRRTLGSDIDASCGQLRRKYESN